jgi:hypothetical protein
MPGGGLPITHSPLNRMRTSVVPNPTDLAELLQQIIDGFASQVEDYLFPAIEQLTGIDLSAFLPILQLLELDFSSPEAFLTSLWAAIIALPGILVQVVTGVINELLSAGSSEQLTALLGGLLTLLVSLPEMLVQLATSLINSGAGLLGIQSPLNALNLFNLVPTDLLSHIPASNIGTALTNLITDPHFSDAANFSGNEVYFHDATQGHAGPGSARTVADGSGAKELLSNLIPVSKDQVLPISGWVKWSGLTAAGGTFPVQLNVTGYVTGSDVTQQSTLTQRSSTPPTTDWTQLSGTYTVPADVTAIRVRLTVTPAATAGTVWWDDLSATKTQNIFQRLIAGQNPGQNLTNDIEGLFSGVVTNALSLLSKAPLSDFNDLVSTIGGDIQEGFEDIGDRINAFLTGSSPLNAGNINTGNIADQFVPGLSTIHDALVTAVGNLSGHGFDIAKVLEVLTGQTHAVVDSSSSLVGMFARLSQAEQKLAALPVSLGGTGVGLGFGGVTGVTDTDDFERVGSNPGSQWLVSYQGGAGTVGTPNGHDLSFQTSGIDDRDYLMIRNNSAILRSATDYQRVIQVVSAKSTRFYDALLGTYNYAGESFIWLRISDATTSLANVTGIRIGFGGDGNLSIVRCLAGAPTILKAFPPGTITPPGPGAILIGEAGDLNGGTAGQRHFRGIIGSSLRIETTEVGTASGFGAAFRRWGTGGRAEGHLLPLPGQEKPASLHYWTGLDQQL